jgi:hypothetical protein
MVAKMPISRRILIVAGFTVTVAAGSLLAQPAGDADKAPDVTIPMEKKVTITPKEMLSRSENLIEEMKGMLDRVLVIQQAARKQKDVIRLNCVNDRLLQVKKLLNIAEASRNDLVEAIAADSEVERYHQFGKVTISHEKVSVLRDEAEACVGEELIFLGPTEVVVDRPPIVDDPTQDDPFDLSDSDIERPAFASPFL